MIRYTRIAENSGYESVWVSEDLGFRDAIVPLASLAMSTSKIGLATGIIPMYYRTAALAAMTVATLDEISGSRIILGLGSGVRAYVEQQGIKFSEPLAKLEEYVRIIRLMLGGETPAYRSPQGNLSGAGLNFKPARRSIPVYIAARGPRMFQLAGKIADGVLMSDGFCSPDYVKWALGNIRVGAGECGRRVQDVDLASFVITSVSDKSDLAKERAKPAVISLLVEGVFDPHLGRMGLSMEDLAPVKEAWLKGKRREAEERVTDELMDASAIYGTPDECRRRMEKIRCAGIKLPIVTWPDHEMAEAIRLASNW